MTNEQLNEAIHSWMGFCCHDFSGTETYKNDDGTEGELDVCIHCGTYEANETEWRDPDYCESHYSVREFLEAINRSQNSWEWAVEQLVRDKRLKGQQVGVPKWDFSEGIFYGVWLTPRELAEAGAKAVGIWRNND